MPKNMQAHWLHEIPKNKADTVRKNEYYFQKSQDL